MSKRVWPAWANLSDIFDILRLSAPIAVSRSSFMLMVLTDTIILGRNAPEELPYVMNSWLPIGILIGISSGLLLGVSVLTAELSGKGEAKDSGRIFRRGLILAAFFGIIFSAPVFFGARSIFTFLKLEGVVLEGTVQVCRILCFAVIAQLLSNAMSSYLEALRRPLLVTVAMYIGVGANLFFDLAFVSGFWGLPKLGAQGVALATTGTNWCLVIVFLIIICLATPGFRRSASGPVGEAWRQIKVGLGMAVSSAVEFGAFNFTNIIATWISIATAAVYGMTFQTVGFIFMSFLGVGTATSVRVAERFGKNDTQGVVNASRLGVMACLIVGLIAAGFMFSIPGLMASVFVQPDAIVSGVNIHPLLSSMIALAGFAVIFDGLQNVSAMASRAQGRVWAPALIHIGCYLGLMLPLAYGLGIGLERGVRGLVEAIIIASFVAGMLQLGLLEFSGRKLVKMKTAE